MIQTREDLKKPHFGPNLGHPTNSFLKIWLRKLLDIMASYYHVLPYQKKLVTRDGQKDGQTEGRE